MKLYKYKSLANLWHVLDIVINQRIYCAKWSELNDPLEGRYEIYLSESSEATEARMAARIDKMRDSYRVGSLSADSSNFLMWSHYADGHKGVALEVEITDENEELTQVIYSPFNPIFTETGQTKEDMRHLFRGKGEEWEYEKEYRLITEKSFYLLCEPVRRILLGPLVPTERESMLRRLFPNMKFVRMKLDSVQGTLTMDELEGVRYV